MKQLLDVLGEIHTYYLIHTKILMTSYADHNRNSAEIWYLIGTYGGF